MSTPVVTPPHANGGQPNGRGSRGAGSWLPHEGRAGSARLPAARRRSIPHLVLGALLVAACATGFAVAASSVDHRHPVLALARPVRVGQVVTGADVREVRVATGAGMDVIPAGQAGSVLGRTMAVSLPAGALLTPAELGTAAVPPAGEAVVAELVKAGQFPPDLAAGAHVLIVPTPTSAGTAGKPAGASSVSGGPWPATVLGVQPTADGQGSVVTVRLPDTQARQLAALPAGGVSVVLVHGGGR